MHDFELPVFVDARHWLVDFDGGALADRQTWFRGVFSAGVDEKGDVLDAPVGAGVHGVRAEEDVDARHYLGGIINVSFRRFFHPDPGGP